MFLLFTTRGFTKKYKSRPSELIDFFLNRDILLSGVNLPVLGIPAGVKMYSSVFSMNIRHAIDVFDDACREGI